MIYLILALSLGLMSTTITCNELPADRPVWRPDVTLHGNCADSSLYYSCIPQEWVTASQNQSRFVTPQFPLIWGVKVLYG